MSEPEYVDPMTERIVNAMRERGLNTEEDFLRVKGELLDEHGEDAFAAGLLDLTWRDVQRHL
jgi:hypothetical protein